MLFRSLPLVCPHRWPVVPSRIRRSHIPSAASFQQPSASDAILVASAADLTTSHYRMRTLIAPIETKLQCCTCANSGDDSHRVMQQWQQQRAVSLPCPPFAYHHTKSEWLIFGPHRCAQRARPQFGHFLYPSAIHSLFTFISTLPHLPLQSV